MPQLHSRLRESRRTFYALGVCFSGDYCLVTGNSDRPGAVIIRSGQASNRNPRRAKLRDVVILRLPNVLYRGLLIVNESANYSTAAMFRCLDRISGAGRFPRGDLRGRGCWLGVSLFRDLKDFGCMLLTWCNLPRAEVRRCPCLRAASILKRSGVSKVRSLEI